MFSASRDARSMIMVVLAVAGCSAVPKQVVADFDQGARDTAAAENRFLTQLRKSDCAQQFHQAAFEYTVGGGPLPSIGFDCTPKSLTDRQIALRRDALGALSVYADKLQALASGTNEKLDSGAEELAKNLQFTGAKGVVAAAVEAAVIELANIALDRERFREVKTAATAAAASIKVVVRDLKSENPLIADYIGSADQAVEQQYYVAMKQQSRGPEAYFRLLEANRAIAAADPYEGASTGSGAEREAKRLNDALDALEKANTALAEAKNEDFVPLVEDLVVRAEDARKIEGTLGD